MTEQKKELVFAAPQWSVPEHAQFQLWKDISTRICSCHHCKRPIVKQSQRIVMVLRRNRAQRLGNGGIVTKDRLFFHPACITELINLQPLDRVHRCVDCGQPSPKDIPAFINKRYIWGRICGQCADEGRWACCSWCRIYFPAYQIQRTVPLGADACNYCVLRNELYTAAEEKKDKRIFSLYRKKILERVRA